MKVEGYTDENGSSVAGAGFIPRMNRLLVVSPLEIAFIPSDPCFVLLIVAFLFRDFLFFCLA